jgi:EVE domain
MTKYWLAVVQQSHVLRGVELGIVQTSHGAKGGIQRMSPGDGLVYYSPKTDYPDGAPLRQFTALGTIAEGEAWQELQGEFNPWRRRVDYDSTATPTPIASLLDELELTRGNSHWGMVMRRGQVELTEADYLMISREMHSAE